VELLFKQVVPNEDILNQMKSIYQSLVEGDAKGASHHMEQHIQYFIDKIKMRLLSFLCPA
jgi:DNA-binding GntR family transcriptional regulator